MGKQFNVHISHLEKRYSGRQVLSIDSLSLASGTSYALIGSNGSGKTTLLRALAGTSEIGGGSIDVSEGIERASIRVGYMPQKAYVFGFSVFRNVAMAARAQALDKAELEKRVGEALAAVGVDQLAGARGNTLSGGEAQRVALARIFVQDLDVVLLDEPTASMDIEGTLLVEQALAEYRARTGCLMLTATHAPTQAKRIAQEAIMLHAGRIVEQGPIERVLSQPESKAGQEFLSYWQV